MATNDVKITTTVVPTTAAKTAAVPKVSEVKTAAVKPAAAPKATASKTPAPKAATPKAKAAPTPKAKAAASKAKSAPAPKAKAPARGGRKKVQTLDDVTTAVWDVISKVNLKNIETPIAIQVNVNDTGIFHIAIKDDGSGKQPHVIQTGYDDRDGLLEVTYDEVMKAAKGKYNYKDAITSGVMRYAGDLRKAFILANMFK